MSDTELKHDDAGDSCPEPRMEERIKPGPNPCFDRLLRHFSYSHLPERLQKVSSPFSALAFKMALHGSDNVPETMAGLRKLLEAKDCAVRAVI